MADQSYLTVPHLDRVQLARIFGNITVDSQTGCWVWRRRLDVAGYGRVSMGRERLVHRVMYAWLVGPIRNGRGPGIPVIDHVCSNRSCCNVAHLELVADAENVRRSRGRAAINIRKTHCINGHVLPAPKVVRTSGKIMRTCRVCKSAYDSRRYAEGRRRDAKRVEVGIGPSLDGPELLDKP